MSALLYCKACGMGYAVVGLVPKACPECREEADWTTTPPPREYRRPTRRYELNFNDRKFLRSLRIVRDDPPS